MRRHSRFRITLLVGALGGVLAYAAPPATVYVYDDAGNVTRVSSNQTDPQNCGAVGNACPTYSPCCAGTCAVADPQNCGACGVVCSTNHLAPTCPAGVCDGTCASGYGDCNGDKRTDGCETNLATDVTKCGSCTTPCSTNHISPSCTNGSCAGGVCAAGYADCNANQRTDGCEVDLMNDANNCGTCGNRCTVPNGWGKCVTGRCTIGGCNTGYKKCGTECVLGTVCP